MTNHYLSSWLNQTSLGQYTQTHEARFFQQNLTGIYAPVIVQMTLPEWQITTNQNVIKMEHDVMMQPEALAWANESIHVLLMPHLLEYCTEPSSACSPRGTPVGALGTIRAIPGEVVRHSGPALILTTH